MAHKDSTVAKALKYYQDRSDLSTKEIAEELDIALSTLASWVTRAGLTLRQRGRKKQVAPNARDRKILAMTDVLSLEETAKRMGMLVRNKEGELIGCKQAVHRIVKRWENWRTPSAPPYKVGDKIRWKRKTYTIVSAGPLAGTVKDANGRLIRNFGWNMDGEMAKKVT